jgi:hypothetical protein
MDETRMSIKLKLKKKYLWDDPEQGDLAVS